MPRPKIAILASGSGTTAESFVQAVANGNPDVDIKLLISNNGSAGVFDKIKKLNQKFKLDIKPVHIGSSNFLVEADEEVGEGRQTMAEEQAILKELTDADIDLVLLMGYMKLIGPSIVKHYGWTPEYTSVYQARMMNTHPGLLPSTKGLYGVHVQQKVVSDKHLRAGHSLFVVNSDYDDGPVVAEHRVEVLPDDTADSLFERVKDSERLHLPTDIQKFILDQQDYLKLQ